MYINPFLYVRDLTMRKIRNKSWIGQYTATILSREKGERMQEWSPGINLDMNTAASSLITLHIRWGTLSPNGGNLVQMGAT